MKYGVVVEQDGGIALFWAETKEAAEERLLEYKRATPEMGSRRYTIVEVLWSISD